MKVSAIVGQALTGGADFTDCVAAWARRLPSALAAVGFLAGYHRWTAVAQPLLSGRKVYFWQTIRSGVMIYTDHLMPELRSYDDLVSRSGPEDRLGTMRREWNMDAWGMTPGPRNRFEILLKVPIGEDEALLLKRRQP